MAPPATGNSSGSGSSSSSKSSSGPVCICLEPTRDLVSQTLTCYQRFASRFENPRLSIEAVMGGGPAPQKPSSQNGDILVGTLDKVTELVKRRVVSLHRLQMLIIDEADDVIKDQGTRKLVEVLMRLVVCGSQRRAYQRLQQLATEASGSRPQTLFFSATLHGEEAMAAITQLAPQACWVDLKGTAVLPDTVKVAVYDVDATQGLQCPLPFDMKETPETDGVHTPQVVAAAAAAAPTAAASGDAELLSCRIKQLKPRLAVALADALKMDCCMIVCRTNLDCDLMERYLQKLGGGKKFSGPMESGKENPYACVVVAGMRSTQDRHTNLEPMLWLLLLTAPPPQHFKAGAARFLICTDVAARGIDINNLPFLIMLTLPDAPEQFFHRVGRVGRADCMGLAICLVSKQKERVCSLKAARPEFVEAPSLSSCRVHGGCTIWYDEPDLLSAIEKKVGKELPHLHSRHLYASGLLLPDLHAGIIDPFGKLKALENDETKRKRGESKLETPLYGVLKSEQVEQASRKNLQEIAASVSCLLALDQQTQHRFSLLAAGHGSKYCSKTEAAAAAAAAAATAAAAA
ncbi:hypothetical protein ACSSS7_004609 [Eimeria intestinalis]